MPDDVAGVSGRDITGSPDIEQVYREQAVALRRLAFLLSGTREQADDIVQTVFATAHLRWSHLEQPVAYLRRAVVNQAKDSHRRRYRRRPPAEPEPVTYIPELDETWARIQRLPALQRAVVVLRFYEDLPLTEIAEVLGRHPGTVRSDLHRALDHLRRTLR